MRVFGSVVGPQTAIVLNDGAVAFEIDPITGEIVLETRSFPVPREGSGFSYRSSNEVSLARSAFLAVSYPHVRPS